MSVEKRVDIFLEWSSGRRGERDPCHRSDRLRLICIHLPSRGEDDDYWIIGLVRSRRGCTRNRLLEPRERERSIVKGERQSETPMEAERNAGGGKKARYCLNSN